MIPIPSLYGFWHGASLRLHTFYGNVFYTCTYTVKVEILGSVIFSVNGKRHGSVRRIFRYYVLWTIGCAFIRMYMRQLHVHQSSSRS